MWALGDYTVSICQLIGLLKAQERLNCLLTIKPERHWGFEP